ncbi:WhiB family transcriptional regulator [Rhodococcus sp. BH5]|uniref:WhiB family transcriptional regulator n=1 Tax=Rhodococcus sp. BH5 TaxID=2871702 RepID=UPI003FA6F5DA
MQNKDLFQGVVRGHVRTVRDQQQRQRAVAICLWCPVLIPCLQFALATKQCTGIWGGIDMSLPRDEAIRFAARTSRQT